MKTKIIIIFFVLIFANLSNFCGFFKFYENYVKAENNDDQDIMKSEDWKTIAQESKNEQEDGFKYIQNDSIKDESPNDINFYYYIGLGLLIIGVFGIICSLCSIFRIRNLKKLNQKK